MKKRFLEIYIPLSIVFGPILSLFFNGSLIVGMGISMGFIIGIHSLMLELKKTKSLKKMQEATDEESSE